MDVEMIDKCMTRQMDGWMNIWDRQEETDIVNSLRQECVSIINTD